MFTFYEQMKSTSRRILGVDDDGVAVRGLGDLLRGVGRDLREPARRGARVVEREDAFAPHGLPAVVVVFGEIYRRRRQILAEFCPLELVHAADELVAVVVGEHRVRREELGHRAPAKVQRLAADELVAAVGVVRDGAAR